MSLLLMAMLLSASPVDEGPAQKIEQLRVPSEVYWAAYRASGAKLCNPTLRNIQEREFNKRFGIRVSKLIATITAKEGEQRDDLIVTSSCLSFANPEQAKVSQSGLWTISNRPLAKWSGATASAANDNWASPQRRRSVFHATPPFPIRFAARPAPETVSAVRRDFSATR